MASFFSLPRELRDKIYDLLLVHDQIISVKSSIATTPNQVDPATTAFRTLRATARQVDLEAQQRYFTANNFYLRIDTRKHKSLRLDTPCARFDYAHIRQLVIDYITPVSDDIFGYVCVQISIALRCLPKSVGGTGGWQLRRCLSYEDRNQRPPAQVYGAVEAAILAFLASKPNDELLGFDGLERIIGIIERELIRVL